MAVRGDVGNRNDLRAGQCLRLKSGGSFRQPSRAAGKSAANCWRPRCTLPLRHICFAGFCVSPTPQDQLASQEKHSRFRHGGNAMETTSHPTEASALESIAYLRCGVRVTVACTASALTLNYDAVDWRSKCCCAHLASPTCCGSFLDLERAKLKVLPHPQFGGGLPIQ